MTTKRGILSIASFQERALSDDPRAANVTQVNDVAPLNDAELAIVERRVSNLEPIAFHDVVGLIARLRATEHERDVLIERDRHRIVATRNALLAARALILNRTAKPYEDFDKQISELRRCLAPGE